MTTNSRESDEALKQRVTDQLGWAPDVDASHVGVAVTDGAVTIAGEVDTEHEKNAVLRAAFHVPGLSGLADELVVRRRAGGYEDVDIVRSATRSLASLTSVPEGSVHLTVHDGRVLLAGTLGSSAQRDEVDRVVRSTPGVTAVFNVIDLSVGWSSTADEAVERILVALLRHARVVADGIRVEARGTMVELSGTVPSLSEVVAAARAAAATTGVTHVRNNLRVAP